MCVFAWTSILRSEWLNVWCSKKYKSFIWRKVVQLFRILWMFYSSHGLNFWSNYDSNVRWIACNAARTHKILNQKRQIGWIGRGLFIGIENEYSRKIYWFFFFLAAKLTSMRFEGKEKSRTTIFHRSSQHISVSRLCTAQAMKQFALKNSLMTRNEKKRNRIHWPWISIFHNYV